MAPVDEREDARGSEAAVAADDRGPIQSIDRAANILGLFDEHTRTLSASLVAERLGLNRTTAHRYLQAMQGAGFLSGSNGPGPLIDQLAALVSTRQQIVTLAPPVLRRLSDRTRLTAVLSFLGRTGAVVSLVEEATDGDVLLTVRVGTVLEFRAAQSRVLFAFQSDPSVVSRVLGELRPAEAVAEQTVLAKVRRDRVAWADLGHTGLASVAAPVFGSDDVHAAIGILGTEAMLTEPPHGAERVQALREAADDLSRQLSG